MAAQGLLERLRGACQGRYEIERELGRGGSATVFLARDLRHKRQVAIKVLRPELAAAVGSERFLREIETTASFTHPHILPLLDSGGADDLLYYVMPYVEGESLRDRMRREKQLPIEDAVSITRDVARALEYAHEHGVLHRDIKPENILLEAGEAVVADFGIARAIEGGEGLTATGVAIGTPAYMSPEQASGIEDLTPRSDLYSLGCVLYEMLAGEPPYTGSTAESVVQQHLSAPLPDVKHLRPSVPEDLSVLIGRMLAKVPADRFATAHELRAVLESRPLFGSTPQEAATEAKASSVLRNQPRWQRSRAALVAGALTIMAAGVIVYVILTSNPPSSTPEPTRLAVLPFDVHGREHLAYLGEGMVSLLSSSLDGVGDLRCIDSRALLRWAERKKYSTFDPEVGSAVAQRFGAGLFVLGDVLEAGPRLRLQATVYQHHSEPEIVAQVASEGSMDSLTFLVDKLTREVATRLVPAGVNTQMVASAARTTDSVAALKEFLRGEWEGRRGARSESVAAFERASELDTTFALAWYRLAILGGAAGGGATDVLWHERTMLDRALRHTNRLSDRDRELILAHRARVDGDLDDFDRRMRNILAVHPEDIEALEDLGWYLAEMNPIRGRSPSEARDILYRALDIDPENATAVQHLIDICAIEGKWAELDSLASDYLARVSTGDERLTVLLGRALYLGTPEQADSAAATLSHSPGILAVTIFKYAMYGENLERTIQIDRMHRVSGNLSALYRAGMGRWSDARALWQESRRGPGAFYYSVACAAPLPNISTADRAVERSWLESIPVSDAYGVTGRGTRQSMDPDHPAISRVLREYLLGLLSARLGEDDRALQHASYLGAMRDSGDAEWRNAALDFAASIRATVFLAHGDAEAGLAELKRAPMKAPLVSHSPFWTRNYERFLRAELLNGLGRDEEALRWYATMPLSGQHGIIYLAPCHLRQAQIYERMGDHEMAVHHYSRFIDLWKDCDPELRPMMEDAQRRMEALLAEPQAS